MSPSAQPLFGGMPPVGRVTKWLCGIILVASLVFSLTARHIGFGFQQLVFSVPGLLKLQLWRLVTYPFVIPTPLDLIISLLVLWFFGASLESRWGPRDFLRFFFLSSIGAALISIPLFFLFNLILPFHDVGFAAGPGPAIDAMLIALALTMPTSNVLLGFVLPIRVRTVVLILLAYEVVVGIMTNASSLSTTLGGMAMGYLLVTGMWRPTRLHQKIEMWKARRRRSKRGLYVVPPDDHKHTLH